MNVGTRQILSLGLAFAFGGCASAHIVSQRDPAVEPDHYKTLLVDAALGSLPESQQAEMRVTRSLVQHGYLAYAEEELFFPQREYLEEQVDAVLDSTAVDAVLVVRLRDAGYESSYVPREVTTRTRVHSQRDEDEETIEVGTQTEEAGGYDVARPWADYFAELYDRGSGELVWYAEVRTEGQFGWGHDYEDLARVAADRLVGKLREDRLLAKSPNLAAEKELFGEDASKPLRLRRRSY